MADQDAQDPQRAELVARAWELAEMGHSVRYIAEAIGKSPATAHRFVREGRAAAVWVEVLDRSEERARRAMRLDMYTDWLISERQTLGGLAREYVPILLKLERERAMLTGSDSPTRVSVQNDPVPPTVDPETVRQVRAMQESKAREVSDLRAGTTNGEDPTP